jgi:diguanylate cyclase (GGDEF)-like protein
MAANTNEEDQVTLRVRLTISFVLVVLVPLLVGIVLVGRSLPNAVEGRQSAGVATAATLTAEVVVDACERARSTAETAARAGAASGVVGTRAAVASLVERGLADGIRVTGPDGRTVAASGTPALDATDCSRASTTLTAPFVTAVVPLTTAGGKAAGTAAATLDLRGAALQRLKAALGDGDVLLLDGRGTVVAGTRTLAPAALAAALGPHPPRSRIVTSYLPARAGGQSLGVLVVQDTVQAPSLLADAGVVVLVAVLLAICIAVLSARSTTQPLEELGRAAARIASGDLSSVIEVRSRDEVGRLAVAFNAMTDDLRSYVGQLEASRDELQNGLSRLGDTLSSTHDLDRILHVVLESAVASTRATSGMVLLLTPSRDALVPSATKDLVLPEGLMLPVGEGVSGRVALAGEPLRGRFGDGPGELRPAVGEPDGQHLIAVPLRSGGTVIGVLDLFGDRAFDDSDLATIRTFASQASVALENVLLHEEAQRLSITDGLTGLWNYRYFTMTVSKEIERAARFGRPLALLMLDLDHFKRVNDTFGHQRGDEVLVELAARIRSVVRDVDTVARYGGEEVVVILPETDVEGAAQLADRICALVRDAPFGDVSLTVSAGAAVFPHHGLSASVLLSRADEALYEAKRGGRDQWRLSAGASAAVPSD